MFNNLIFKVSSFILLTFLSLSSFAQQNHDEMIQRFLEQRKKMMEEIMKSFNEDSLLGDDFFGDDFFEEFKKHGFNGAKGFSHTGRLVSVEEKVNNDGSIDIIIKPKDKNIKLDIQTTDDSIQIKGESFVSEENQNSNQQSRSMFKSTFSRTIPIPSSHKAKSPKEIKDGLKITLVPKNKDYLKKNKDGKTPVGKLPGQETI